MDVIDNAEPDKGPVTETSESAADAGRITLRQKRRRAGWRVVKTALVVGTGFTFVAVGAVVGYLDRSSDVFKTWRNELWRHPVTIITHPTDPLAAFTPALQLPAKDQHIVNLLLVGADSDYEEARPVALKNTHGRSDALMVVQVDFDRNRMAVLSIPRDTAVMIPDYDGRVHKINAAHAYGGPQLAQKTVESAFGIHTDYFVSLNFEAFQKVVDAIGGVDLTVPKALDYDDNWGRLHIHLKPGLQHLDGYRAMGYVRIRKPDDDIHRAERQHEFMEAMRAKITQPSTFMKLPEALNQITKNIDSDLLPAQQLTFANFARGVTKENFQVATLPSTAGRSFVYVNVPESEKLISQMFFAGRPNSVTVTVPDRPLISSRRTLLARANTAEHRRRHRRRRTVPSLHTAPVGSSTGESGSPVIPEPTSPLSDGTGVASQDGAYGV